MATSWFCSAARSWLLLLAALSVGCGIQLGPGLRANPHTGNARPTVELGARLHRVRESGPYGAVDLTLRGNGEFVSARNLAVGIGYRLVASHALRLELGPELAIGNPIQVQYEHSGLYAGLVGTVLVRACGTQTDNALGSAPFGWALDVAGTVRGGRWAGAFGDHERAHAELGGAIGLRLTLLSDLIVASQTSWEGPWDAQ